MEGKLNRKLILFIVKYGTWMIGLAYLLQIMLTCFGIQSFILTDLFGLAIIPTIALLAFSFFLGFCYWHRLPIYYALSANIINIIDFYIGIPVIGKHMLIIYLLLAGLFIIIGCLIKNEEHAKERDSKKNST